MYKKCLYLRIRTKQGKPYMFCVKYRKMVKNDCYNGCDDLEFKVPKKLVAKKPMKKVSKKRKSVSNETYEIVYERCQGKCALCGATRNLELHHILFRSERPDLIDDPDNCILLCGEFANNCHKGKAHAKKKFWQPILKNIVKQQKDDNDMMQPPILY